MSAAVGTVDVLNAGSRTGAAAVLAWALTIWRVAAAAGLAVLTGLVLWSLLPLGLGWGSHVVVSDSMAPGIMTGDVVVAQPATPADILPGQVILFTDPAAPGRTVVHRFLRYDDAGLLVTRGDANQSEDSTALEPTHVRALPRLLIPWVGQPATWLRHGRWRPLAVSVVIGVLALVAVATVREDDPTSVPEHDRRLAMGFDGPAEHLPIPAIAAPAAPGAAPTSRRPQPIRRRRPSQPSTWSTPFPTEGS